MSVNNTGPDKLQFVELQCFLLASILSEYCEPKTKPQSRQDCLHQWRVVVFLQQSSPGVEQRGIAFDFSMKYFISHVGLSRGGGLTITEENRQMQFCRAGTEVQSKADSGISGIDTTR